jgi:hypothetical protein
VTHEFTRGKDERLVISALKIEHHEPEFHPRTSMTWNMLVTG